MVSFDTQDEEFLSILKELQVTPSFETDNNINRLSGRFCSDTVFNLSKRNLSEIDIKVLEKGLDCSYSKVG